MRRDRQADRAVARLRLVGALVVGASTLLLAAGSGGSIRWLVVALGAIFSLAWFAAYGRSRSVHSDEDELRWDRSRLSLRAGKTSWSLPWREVRAVEADEERLRIRVLKEQGEETIPLVWRGYGLHDLAETLEEARCSAE